MFFGWMCIKCGRVYSPQQLECLYCNREIEKQIKEDKEPETVEDINQKVENIEDFIKKYHNIGDENDEDIKNTE